MENIKKSQLNCRLLYREMRFTELNLSQLYVELSNLVQASGKIQAADSCLYCYFDNSSKTLSSSSDDSSEILSSTCKAGIHIVGWETGLQDEVLDFSKIDFERFPIATPQKSEDLVSSYLGLIERYKTLSLKEYSLRLSCEFELKDQSFKIQSYLDFFNS